jgi:PAS domain S-box-containing protein
LTSAGDRPRGTERTKSESEASEVELLRERLEELEERYESLRLLVHNLPIGLFSMDDPRSGRMSQANPAMARVFGFGSTEDLKARNANETYADPKERAETFARFLADPGFRASGIAKFESVRLRRDGTPFPALITVCTTFGEDGSISRFDGAVEDVTERKRAERGFLASEERFRIVFENAEIGIALTDMQGAITRANPALCRFLQRSETNLVGVRFDDLLAGEDRTRPVVGRPGEAGSEPPGRGSERRYATARGDQVTGYTSVSWLSDGEGRPFQAAVVVQDVTLRRKLEDEMNRVQRLESLSLLSGGIAHDFNNFLAAIVANIGLALKVGDDQAECLTAAQDAALRARDVTRQLLTFAAGGAPVKRTASLLAVAREAAAFCLRGTAVTCAIREAPGLPLVDIDEGQIGQVFSNLFINAAEAMPAGGPIEVDADVVDVDAPASPALSPGRYVRTTITDHGAGIAPDVLPRIFDPYFTTKNRGSGLGLATVHSIVKRHGGHVEVRSEPSRGSTFTIYLPAAEARVPHPAPPSRPAAQPLDARVLVMDDEAPVRRTVTKILEGVGCQVHAVADGEAALSAWSEALGTERPFDVAILDLTVRGGVGGEETMRRLRAIDPHALAIVSSGYSESPVMSRHADHGFAGVASKPYTVEELVQTLARVLQGSQRHARR